LTPKNNKNEYSKSLPTIKQKQEEIRMKEEIICEKCKYMELLWNTTVKCKKFGDTMFIPTGCRTKEKE